MFPSELPPLDCHAHIAPDVTTAQITGLHSALVFAMTRTAREAHAASRRADSTLVWGYGAHPRLPAALASVNRATLAQAVLDHTLIGEVGLDRQGPAGPQHAALETILEACRGQPVLISLHSTGRTREPLGVLRQQTHPGAILHWFNGTAEEIAEAAELGCYFSVNMAMSDERLSLVPRAQMLPETDFPASRRTIQATKPGDTTVLERRLADRDGVVPAVVRRGFYRNLERLSDRAGALPRLPINFRKAFSVASSLQ